MKRKIKKELIYEDYKEFGFDTENSSWIECVDNKIVDFKNDLDIVFIDGYMIHIYWTVPLNEKQEMWKKLDSLLIDLLSNIDDVIIEIKKLRGEYND